MLSEETNARIARLAAAQSVYRPNATARALLASKTLVMLVGATCTGKSTLMHELETEVPTVGTITSRPARPDDALHRYTFYPHTDEGLAPLLSDIEAGNLVQYAVNPHSGYIYGSRVSDYPGTTAIGDYFSSVVAPFASYGFDHIIVVSVIAPADQWLGRFNTRFPADHPERQARLAEAQASLEWSLSQPTMQWVINRDNASQVATTAVKNLIRGEGVADDAEARALAEACVKTIEELRHV